MKSAVFKINNNTPSSLKDSESFHIPIPVSFPIPVSIPLHVSEPTPINNNIKSDAYIHKNFAYKHSDNIFYVIH